MRIETIDAVARVPQDATVPNQADNPGSFECKHSKNIPNGFLPEHEVRSPCKIMLTGPENRSWAVAAHSDNRGAGLCKGDLLVTKTVWMIKICSHSDFWLDSPRIRFSESSISKHKIRIIQKILIQSTQEVKKDPTVDFKNAMQY